MILMMLIMMNKNDENGNKWKKRRGRRDEGKECGIEGHNKGRKHA